MTSIYALITNGMVTNMIVADPVFIQSNPKLFDQAMQFDPNGFYPSTGHSVDKNGNFMDENNKPVPINPPLSIVVSANLPPVNAQMPASQIGLP